MLIGKKIKDGRLKMGLSQEGLAEKLDTTRQTISSWENGKTYPGIQTITTLSDMFNVPVESLIKEDVEIMRNSLSDSEKDDRIKRNKDRDVLNRLNMLRFLNAFIGALILFPVRTYLGSNWLFIPIILLVSAIVITIPIQIYRKKYNLHKYKDIVEFFDERYNY